MTLNDPYERRMAEAYQAYAAQPALARLADGRKMVPGYGPLDSPLMVIGEAPGEQEEKQGRPFVGPAGKLLRKIFLDADLLWECCYVTNVVPWRPPGNRTPYPFEVQLSQNRLAEEMSLADPVVIVAAGDVAWRCITRGNLGPFAEARFSWSELGTRRLLAVPHPSYLLRLSGTERQDWQQRTTDVLAQALPKATA